MPVPSGHSKQPTYQAIEVEKRVSREFNTIEVDPVLVEDVLRLYLEEETSRGLNHSFPSLVSDLFD